MLSIFDFQDYREFLKSWLQNQAGRGASSRLATALGISPSMMSLVLKGDKNLSAEQATELVEFLTLNDLESDYFFILLELARAGSHKLQLRLQKRKDHILAQAKKISTRVKKDLELTEEQRSVYYSNWYYTAVRNLSACSSTQELQKISEHLKVPVEVLQPIVEFLVTHNLCKLEKGQLTYGPKNMHLNAESPYANLHHRNWRQRGEEKMNHFNPADLFYTCPMSLSQEAFEEVRKLLPTVIQQVLKIVGPSESEVVACFNMDFYTW